MEPEQLLAQCLAELRLRGARHGVTDGGREAQRGCREARVRRGSRAELQVKPETFETKRSREEGSAGDLRRGRKAFASLADPKALILMISE